MKILLATLCDFANIRERLLTIVSAGITRHSPDGYPCPLAMTLALMLELPYTDVGVPHELEVRIQDEDGGDIASAVTAFAAEVEGLDPGEPLQVPLVLDLRVLALQREGRYQITIDPRSRHADATVLAFRAMPAVSQSSP